MPALQLRQEFFERSAIENGRPRPTTARAIAALCVGGMVVARAMVNRAAADELRDACVAVALDLGGWEQAKKLRNGKPLQTQRFRTATA
jgi:TetR/AcrR family transcriptional regulator, transcriptional repressor for nem operon